jgi:amidase
VVAHASALLPNLADSARLYMRLLTAAKSTGMTTEGYEEAQRLAAALDPGDNGLGAERTRGTVMTHRDWLDTDRARALMQQQWRTFFREWDVVVYPAASVPAFPHDHSLPIEARHLEVDGDEYPYYDACFVWADPAGTCGLPATAAPIDRSPTGLPIGIQIIGPHLEDRTPIAFAELLEREFGGFQAPPGYA